MAERDGLARDRDHDEIAIARRGLASVVSGDRMEHRDIPADSHAIRVDGIGRPEFVGRACSN